jgi:hypothetical protein
MPPVSTWGKRFVAIKSQRRGTEGVCEFIDKIYCEHLTDCPTGLFCDERIGICEEWPLKFCEDDEGCPDGQTCNTERGIFEVDVWRILASEDDTVVITTPPQTDTPVTLQMGEYIDVYSVESFFIEASRPVLVGQFLVGQGYGNEGGFFSQDLLRVGDPAFMLVVPVEQFRNNYIFVVPLNYRENYMSVAVRPGTNLILDGVQLQDVSFSPIEGSDFMWATIPLSYGAHKIEADQAFGLTIYGYDEYVSYGYPAGMDLQKINPVSPPYQD